jgi:DNA-directed RNA polymerase specialized sigma24 family protein
VPRDVVALVSADDFVSAVRVYADRVNDLLRRNGVPALEAIEVCETHALALLDAVVNAPETVIDLAGWWFARAIELTSRTGETATLDALDEPISMLAGTAGEGQVRSALAGLPDAERAAVVLRDCYDLPPQAVGVALRRGTDSAAELTAAGRLHLVAGYDGRPVPDLSGHSGRTTVDLVALSKLAEGTLESPRAAPLRRHVGNCPACEEVLESLAKGRRLAAGLPIIAMDDDARSSLIERVSTRAEMVLPSHEAVLRAVDEDHDPGPVVSPVIAVIVLVLALALGTAVAVISRSSGAAAPTPRPIHTILPSETPAFSVSAVPKPHHHSGGATALPTVRTSTPTSKPTHHRTATPKSTKSSAPPDAGPPAISLSPNTGHAGTTIAVIGSGFRPGTTVDVSYANGRSTSTAIVNASGDFTAHLRADALLPGPETVSARDGSKSANAEFTQRL